MMMKIQNGLLWTVCLLLAFSSSTTFAFQPTTMVNPTRTATARVSPLAMSTETPPEKTTKSGYVPKWKKKKTLADDAGDMDFSDKGIKGTISVVFQQGDETKTTMAMPGQPLRDVATQAGQFIKYGCGKGECGTCEAMCDGKWVRPCKDVVPAGVDEVVVTVKEVSQKAKSSGKFFSVRSFFMGFWNNVLGMVGFVKYRRNAKKNWEERQEYEDLIKQKTLEKKRKRREQLAAQQQQDGNDSLSP